MIGIYKVTNIINNKIYIGQSADITRRWKEHHTDPFEITNACYNSPFYRAIRKYGIENFIFEILEECDIEKLDERERYWIKYYNAYIGWDNNCGYNMTIGGQGTRKFDPNTIISLWDQGYSVQEIIEKLNSSYTTVIHYLHTNNRGYVKIEDRKNLIRPIRKVEQYTLNGIYLNTYPSISAAIKTLKDSYPNAVAVNISKACMYQITTAYNYIWKYVEDDTPIEILVANAKSKKHHRNRKVNQYDLQGNFIQTFATIKDAQIAVGARTLTSIINACNGRSKTSNGYIWKYNDSAIGG